MPVQLISPGPVTTLLANVEYALPASKCTIKAGALLQKSTSYGGTYSNWVGSDTAQGVEHTGGGHCKSAVQTTVTAIKTKMGKPPAVIPPTDYAGIILTDGARNHWRFTAANSGIYESDVIGGLTGFAGASANVTYGHTGPIPNGKAIQFVGAASMDQWLAIKNNPGPPTNSPIDLRTPFSLEFWFRTSQAAGSQRGLLFNNTTSTMDRFSCWLTSPGNFAIQFDRASPPGGMTWLQGTRTFRDDAWHHVVITADTPTSNFLMYIDGTLEPGGVTMPLAFPLLGSNVNYLYIGTASSSGYNGYYAELAIYPLVLTPAKIAAHYAAKAA